MVLAALLPLVACTSESDDIPPCPEVKPSGATVAGLAGRIAYHSLAGGGGHCSSLIVVNADGSGRRRLIPPDVYVTSAQWSPDGSRIAFTGACGQGQSEVCVVNADGSGLRAVTGSGGYNADPAWSPDGRRIAFSRPEESLGPHDLYVVDADGTGEVRLTTGPDSESSASWTADGQSLVYAHRFGTEQLRIIKATGGPSTELARGGTVNQTPAVSRDGTRVAFSSNRSGKGESAYGRKIRATPGGELMPPATGAHDIYVVGIDGRGLTRLTDDDSGNYSPVWSPDDGHIAFTSDRDGRQEVYVMTADGRAQARLTHHPEDGAGVDSWTR